MDVYICYILILDVLIKLFFECAKAEHLSNVSMSNSKISSVCQANSKISSKNPVLLDIRNKPDTELHKKRKTSKCSADDLPWCQSFFKVVVNM